MGREHVARWHDVRTIVCACGLLMEQVAHWWCCGLMEGGGAFWLGVRLMEKHLVSGGHKVYCREMWPTGGTWPTAVCSIYTGRMCGLHCKTSLLLLCCVCDFYLENTCLTLPWISNVILPCLAFINLYSTWKKFKVLFESYSSQEWEKIKQWREHTNS